MPQRSSGQHRKPRRLDDANGQSLTESAVEIIRDRILDLTLVPGARIDDKLLMTQFGMGRTPAREAFNRLATEGLIVFQRNKGAFVRPLDIQHVRQLLDAYAASERVIGYFCRTGQAGLVEDLRRHQVGYRAAQAAAKYLDITRLNAAFHQRIALATENEYIFENAKRLYNHARRLSYFIYLTPGFARSNFETMQGQIDADHDEIVVAIEDGDNPALIDALTRHAVFFHERIVHAIGGSQGFGAPLPGALVAPLRRGRRKASAAE